MEMLTEQTGSTFITDKMIKSVLQENSKPTWLEGYWINWFKRSDISNPKVVLEVWYNETCAFSVSTESLKAGSEKNNI